MNVSTNRTFHSNHGIPTPSPSPRRGRHIEEQDTDEHNLKQDLKQQKQRARHQRLGTEVLEQQPSRPTVQIPTPPDSPADFVSDVSERVHSRDLHKPKANHPENCPTTCSTKSPSRSSSSTLQYKLRALNLDNSSYIPSRKEHACPSSLDGTSEEDAVNDNDGPPDIGSQSNHIFKPHNEVHATQTPTKSKSSRKFHSIVDLRTPPKTQHLAVSPDFGTPTPTTEATVAVNAFPFPRQTRSFAGLSPLTTRSSSSPLRPSQWTSLGGSPSGSRTPSQTPDRFIPTRKSSPDLLNSFRLNKSVDQLTPEEKAGRNRCFGPDPFASNLNRSKRLDEQLKELRATHIATTNRGSLRGRQGLLIMRQGHLPSSTRQISAGAVWNIGGSAAVGESVPGVSDGRGGIMGSGTNAPLHVSKFLRQSDPEVQQEAHERRLALAFDVDQTSRILNTAPSENSPQSSCKIRRQKGQSEWKDGKWINEKVLNVLDAPQLRDDFYCTLIAYSPTADCLAVGLGSYIHLWSESKGVQTPGTINVPAHAHITTLSFSSEQGAQAILAVGRADGRISLWSPFEEDPRFDAAHNIPISCVSFRPTPVKRPSMRDSMIIVNTEELLIGDEVGHIYFYSIEWPAEVERDLFDWHGSMSLLARLALHTQQICGLAWSPDGNMFATGGNDNICYLFETRRILHPISPNDRSSSVVIAPANVTIIMGPQQSLTQWHMLPNSASFITHFPGREKLKWTLNAAVKAIAFAPWHPGLLAVGAGSNDRCIHFYHTGSGTALATIDCAAQVTGLVWSYTRKEIAATFGFAQPDHPFRIAVFAWPSCEQIVAIPWYDESRALHAISYPGASAFAPPSEESTSDSSPTSPPTSSVRRRPRGKGTCLVIAASDAAIRFHEVWPAQLPGSSESSGTRSRRGRRNRKLGLLGGSDILEGVVNGSGAFGEMEIR